MSSATHASPGSWGVALGTNRLLDVEVEVRVDGIWHPSWLDPDYWRKTPAGRWEGFVRWSQGPAANYLSHFDQDDTRRT
jgi:hypothetical protein